MFTHIDVSRRPHCAINNLTRDTPRRARPDASGPPPHALRLSAGVPYLPAGCNGPHPDGDGGVPVLLAFQRVPNRVCLSRIRADQDGHRSIAVPLTVFMPWLMRSLGAILTAALHTYGWCRTRWSWATPAATLQTTHGIAVSEETVRRWLHEMG